jgi:ABC-type multidrug transport system fused ATPase/permease subunit
MSRCRLLLVHFIAFPPVNSKFICRYLHTIMKLYDESYILIVIAIIFMVLTRYLSFMLTKVISPWWQIISRFFFIKEEGPLMHIRTNMVNWVTKKKLRWSTYQACYDMFTEKTFRRKSSGLRPSLFLDSKYKPPTFSQNVDASFSQHQNDLRRLNTFPFLVYFNRDGSYNRE